MEEIKTRTCTVCGESKPESEFVKNGMGITNVCKECSNKKKRDSWKERMKNRNLEKELEEAKRKRLEDFTPRQLMERLKQLGYEGKLKYVKVEEIDLSKI